MKLYILFGIIAYVVAVPLDAHCEWGESYWCSDLTVAKKCGALQHCMTTVWSKQILPKDGSEECLFCETIIGEVRKMLDDRQTVDQIQKMLMQVCDVIPSKKMEAKCKSVVQNDLPDLMSTISARLDPQMVCALLGLCNGLEDTVHHPEPVEDTVHHPESDNSTPVVSITNSYCPFKKFREVKGDASKVCTDCKTLIKDLRDTLTSKTTEEQIEKYLKAYICAGLGSLADMCNKEVDSYVPMVMSMLQAQIDPDQICQALCLCQSTHKSRALLATFRLQRSPLYKMSDKVDTTSACIMCKTVFAELQTLDRDPATQKKVIKVMKEKLCSRLGAMEAVCIVAVDKYASDIFELLVNELDPETRCHALGFCKADIDVISNESTLTRLAMPKTPVTAPAVPRVKTTSTCVMCEFVIREIDSLLADNATETEIIQALEKVCSLMPDTLKAECVQFVDEYGKAIIALLEQELDPKQICTVLGLCSSLVVSNKTDRRVEKGEYCGVCEVVIQYLDSLLENNRTVANIEKYLEIVCNFLPQTYRKQCVDLIDKYGAGIIILIEEVADPKVICTQLGLCEASESNETVKMLELQPASYKKDETLLGAGRCTWGPSYWCVNIDNAKKCNAVEHCKAHVWKN